MPDYSTLLRSSSQVPSTHTHRSIRHRSGGHHQSSPSLKVSTGSQRIVGYRPPDVLQTAEAGLSNGHVTATSPSSVSHFTSIPARTRRSSIISSHPNLHRPPWRPAASTIDDPYSSAAHLDGNGDTHTTSSQSRITPVVAISMSFLSQASANIQSLAKRVSSLAFSGLVSLNQKVSSLPDAQLPTFFNSNRPLDRVSTSASAKSFLSTAEKLTHKWPRPRSYRSIPPELRLSPRRLRELKGSGAWSQGNISDILRDSQGLGVNWVGQWTLHKWCLLASVTTVFLLGLTCLVFSLLTWFATYPVAPVLLITDSPALILLTFSSCLLLLASMVGITGTLLNSRPILAIYVLLLFPSFFSFVSVGYVTYKKANFSLDAKVSEAWNLWYSPGARTVLQGALGCCGWAVPLHGAAASGTCYVRSPLPGCHGPLVRFERDALASAAGTVFSLALFHLTNIFTGILCANHVTRRFGKGITPARYRLTVHDIISPESVSKQAESLPVPPLPAPSGHAAFREDRQNGTKYRHAHGKFERGRESWS